MPGSVREVCNSTEQDDDQAQSSSSSSSASSSKAAGLNGQSKQPSGDAQHDGSSETEDDEEEYEDDEDDDQEEEDEEPALRYSRLSTYSQAVQDLLNRDTCSSIAVSSKYIVLATHSGGVCVLSRTQNSQKDKGKGKAKQPVNGGSELENAGPANEAEGYTVVRRYKPHTAAVTDIVIDEDSQFIGTASMDGKVIVLHLATSDAQEFNLKRPLRCLALEPSYATKSARQLVSGGMAGILTMHEKGWLGPKDVALHSGEGPIWACTWRRNLIAWSNDKGIRIYDTHSSSRIAAIPRPDHSPRADLYPCTLLWQTDTTLVSAWADYIKIIKVRDRREEARIAREKEKEKAAEKGSKETDKDSITSVRTTSHNPLAGMSAYVPGFSSTTSASSIPNQPPVYAEVASILQLDCMISSIVPFLSSPSPLATPSKPADALTYENTTNFLVLSHLTPPTSDDDASATLRPSQMPELRIIGVASGEEISSDVLPVSEYERWQCKDYKLVGLFPSTQPSTTFSGTTDTTESYFVISPKDVVLVKKRDVADHIAWLCERKRYEEALRVVEKHRLLPSSIIRNHKQYNVSTIGTRFLSHLLEEQEYEKAASNANKIFAATDQHVKNWENFVFTYAEKEKLDIVIPYIPVENPTLSKLVYELVLVHFLKSDPQTLLQTIETWPSSIYDISSVLNAVRNNLDRDARSSNAPILMECLIELHLLAHQPGKAIQYYLKLRKPGVFDLIRENNLFTDIQDQALLLVDFEMDMDRRTQKEAGAKGQASAAKDHGAGRHGEAIDLLVSHTHSIPAARVVPQLKSNRFYLYKYLDALCAKDPLAAYEYSDSLVDLYAEYDYPQLLDLLRKSSAYNLGRAYDICKEKDYVPEMVYLLGRMGNNKQALMLIIERLGDVKGAIDFAKEQNDHDLWEDLLTYSETKPTFICGLLENVGLEIDPVRLIRRIKNGLEIPGLKPAIIKILQDLNLQISLIEGCQNILKTDCRSLTLQLISGQSSAFYANRETTSCYKCSKPAFLPSSATTSTPTSATSAEALSILFLCRHVWHISCAFPNLDLPPRPQHYLNSMHLLEDGNERGKEDADRDMATKILFASQLKARSRSKISCPACAGKDSEMRK